jgi:hypothetical protein
MVPRSRALALAPAVLLLGLGAAASGQDGRPPGPRVVVADLAEQARFLREDIEWELGRSPEGRHLLHDAEAFIDAVDGLGLVLGGRARSVRLPDAIGQVDTSWEHLNDGLARSGVPPAIVRAAQRTDRVVAALHQALGTRPRPAESFDPGPPPPPPEATGPPPLPVRQRGERPVMTIRLKTISTVIGILGSLIGVVGGIYKYGLHRLLAVVAIGVCLVALAVLGGVDFRPLLGGLFPAGPGR